MKPSLKQPRRRDQARAAIREPDASFAAFRRPRHERRRIIAGICDRLVGDLDRSLHAVRELCDSVDAGSPERKMGA